MPEQPVPDAFMMLIVLPTDMADGNGAEARVTVIGFVAVADAMLMFGALSHTGTLPSTPSMGSVTMIAPQPYAGSHSRIWEGFHWAWPTNWVIGAQAPDRRPQLVMRRSK